MHSFGERLGIAAARVIAAIVLLSLACFGRQSFAAQEIVFAQVASQTNPTSAANARGLATGIQVYFDKVNAKGGAAGAKFKLRTLDDDLQNQKMIQLTEQLIDDPSVIGLLGFLNSGGLAEIAKQNLLGKNKIALIAPLQGDKHVVGADNVFPLRSGYADEVQALLKEAKSWGKDTIAVVSMNIAFGPALAKVATELSGPMGVKIVANPVLNAAPNELGASVQAAVLAIAQNQPKAVLVLAAGAPAIEFIRTLKAEPSYTAQVYGISVLQHNVLVQGIGAAKARGIVLSQAVPFPYVPSRRVITQYQTDMKKFASAESFSFASLEGYLGAVIAVEAVRRAGREPTRISVLNALSNLGEFDLGGVFVNYTPTQRKGWGGVDLSIINASGALQK